MSTLKVTNIQDTGGGNSSTSAEIYSGRAKAWVNFNGQGTVAIRASFNVSSITDLGTAEYRINFSTAMTDTNYSAVCGCSVQADSSIMGLFANRWNGSAPAPSTTSYIECSSRETSAGQVKDIDYGYCAIFR